MNSSDFNISSNDNDSGSNAVANIGDSSELNQRFSSLLLKRPSLNSYENGTLVQEIGRTPQEIGHTGSAGLRAIVESIVVNKRLANTELFPRGSLTSELSIGSTQISLSIINVLNFNAHSYAVHDFILIGDRSNSTSYSYETNQIVAITTEEGGN